MRVLGAAAGAVQVGGIKSEIRECRVRVASASERNDAKAMCFSSTWHQVSKDGLKIMNS